MNSTILNARTVAVVRELRVEKRQGANGEFESKDILVRIAVDRDYKVTRTENGKTISEYPTDFWLAKFTGAVAQVFADHCTSVKEDGKLISRHLLLSGNFENYTNSRKVKVTPQVNINGQLYQLDMEVEVPNNNNTIFVVDSMKFLDKNPENRNAVTATTVTAATAVPVGSPVAPMPVPTPVQPVAPVTPAPVQQTLVAAPAQPVAQVTPATATVAQPVVDMMNPPVVDNGFVPTGEVAPF